MNTPPIHSTYRVQLNRDFTIRDLLAVVPYLHSLGISHVYCSPVLKARPGSTHGYDVTDPTVLNPELGTEEEWRALADDVHSREMGLLLDIVPNHMGIGPDNPYWESVLRLGPASRYAPWFDIDWETTHGKLILPVLGDDLDAILERGELSVEGQGDTARLKYFDNSFPLAPESVGVRDVRELLTRQHYRLVFWRRGPNLINYRRFFDVTELAGLRQEEDDVFQQTHAKILEWVDDGVIDGLRIDHVDGMRDPLGYLQRLREEVDRRRPATTDAERFPIFVEKILSSGEHLRMEWPIEGTTGYEFIAELEGVFLDPGGFAEIERMYRRQRRAREDFDFRAQALEGKRLVLRQALRPDVTRVARLLGDAVRLTLGERVAAPRSLTGALVEFIAHLPVYRTYVSETRPGLDEQDDAIVRSTIDAVSGDAATRSRELALLEQTLRSGSGDSRLEFMHRLQQLSGPAAAKGIEDTALYRYAPLASRNEVGGDPDRPLHDAVARFHRANNERQSSWPRSLVTVTTHDTKRSADARMRLDALSEMSDVWARVTTRWRRAHRKLRVRIDGPHARTAPDANAEYLLYQTLVAIWPSSEPSAETREQLRSRAEAYMLKASREAKERTSWTEGDDHFEDGLKSFIVSLVTGEQGATFRADLLDLVQQIARHAAWSGAGRQLLHLMAPGVPDIYQGDELWNMLLVDPDNRRPVDYSQRQHLLEQLERTEVRDVVANPESGQLKLLVTRAALRTLVDRGTTLREGGYAEIGATGPSAQHIVSFVRRASDGRHVLVAAPRLLVRLGANAAPVGVAVWSDTALHLPSGFDRVQWRCGFTGRVVPSVPAGPASALSAHGENHPARGRLIRVASALDELPVALLLAEPEDGDSGVT